MKKLVLIACILGLSGLYAAEAPKREKSWLEQQEDKPDKKFNFEEAYPEFKNAPSSVKKEIVRGAFNNGRAWWDLMKVTQSIKLLTQPKTLGLIALGALGVFAGWHATSLAADVAKHYILIPPLAQKTSIRGWTSSLKDLFVYDDKTMPERSQVVFNEELAAHIEMLTHSVINAAKNDTFFRHYLFYGPPGTGKTMIAMAMAQEAGLEYIYFSAATLNKYSLEEGIKQINHLFEYAKAYPKKLMIIMDEADSIFSSRDDCSDKTKTFLNQILTYTGTPQSHYMVVGLTNRPKDFDAAALDRFGEIVKIDAPGHTERVRLFAQYAQKYLIDSHKVNRDNRSIYQWIFSRKPVSRVPLLVADDVFTNETFSELADRSEGLAGRGIDDVMLMVQNAAYNKPDQTITKDTLFKALEARKRQRDDLKKDFGQAAAAA